MRKSVSILVMCAVVVMGLLGLTACGDSTPYSNYDLSDYIKVGNYTGLTVDGFTIKVTDKEVQDEIETEVENATVDKKLKNGTKVKNGDTVNIDYVGKMNGKTFDGGSAEGYDLELGSGSFITGFEDGLIGKKVGQKKIKLKLTFPEDYSSTELAGKDVVFTVTINSATRPEKQTYNLAFVKSQGDYKTKAEYEKAIKKKLYKEKKNDKETEQKTDLFDQVYKNSKVKKYPQEELQYFIDVNMDMLDYYAEQYSTDTTTLLSQMGYTSEQAYKKDAKKSSKQIVKQEMIIAAIAQKENLTYTDEEKDELVNQFEQKGYTDETMKMQTGRTIEDTVHMQLLYEKVTDFMLEKAKIKK